jgi:glycerophosphoryl diester phosphodiesterase
MLPNWRKKTIVQRISMSSNSVQRVAHRGGSALAPENTLAAFRQALTLPIDALELDVQMSRDGHAIVFHDETVERLTNGHGNILDLDLEHLRTLNAAAHFAGGWPQVERVPTLHEVLKLAREGNTQVYIEIKPSRRGKEPYGRYPGIAEAATREVLAQNMLAQVLFISFDWQILPLLKILAPGARTGALISKDVWNPKTPLSTLIAQAQALQCNWMNMDYELFTPQMPELFHANGLQLGLWTVNDEANLQRLAQTGIDSVTTDRPDLFTALAK